MQALLKLSRAIDWLNATVGRYAIWLIFAATVISAVNATIRKLFNYSSNGFLEVQWYLFAWSFLIAAGYTLLKREHVRIDVLNAHFPKKVQVWVQIFGLVFFLAPVCITVLYLVIPMTLQMYASGEMSNNPGGLIRWPVWLALPVGFSLLLVQGVSELIKCIAFLKGLGPDPTEKTTGPTDEQALIDALRNQSTKPSAPAQAH
ncbi:MAG TPA: TRAP transporter small permease subunit [Ottowia sp.]|uniref:TRAP transporter small permease subunit n=1 Tax=Ottowia sp. TaxID=1898956 RepID=UPI002BC0B578|nr:TRAP transporter small permease subunit [Ottowia sp.]HMN21592.1 TRAP transporter small permease subunit [Ottowia sp.]